MQNWVDKISSTEFPKIHTLMIDWYLTAYGKVFSRTRPIKSFLITIIVSWFLTTGFSILGRFHPSCNDCFQYIRVWHDYLPWYPSYIYNYIGDTLTIVFTFWVLKSIKGKNLLNSSILIFFDIFLAYSLTVLCYFAFYATMPFFEEKIRLGNSFTEPIQDKEFRKYDVNKNDPLELKLLKFGFSNDVRTEVKNEGFTNNAKIYPHYHPGPWREFSINFKVLVKVITYFVRGQQYVYEYPYYMKLVEGKKQKTIGFSQRNVVANTRTLSTSLTTFIPTVGYLFLLITMYFSKEIFVISKNMGLRVFKSAVEKGSEEDISKFKPGTHFGYLLSAISALIAIVLAIMRL